MEEKKPDKKLNIYVRLSSIVIQMGVIIGGFSWLGDYLDKRQHTAKPIWTIILALSGVMISMYLVFREVKNITKND